jgi:uridine kinase
MIQIIKNPLFLAVLSIKFYIIFNFDISLLPNKFFIPFLSSSVDNFTINPWKYWIDNEGLSSAFPYGYIMWLYFIPFIKFAKIFNIDLVLIYKLALAILDVSLFILLNKMFIKNINYLILIFSLSPLLIVSTYLLGLNDILPIFLLFLSFYFLKKNNFYYSGICLAMSISAKLSMVISVPFFLIFFFNNKNVQMYFKFFFIGFVISFALFVVPNIFSAEAVFMILKNKEIEKIFLLYFSLDNYMYIYAIPLLYTLLVYYTWTVKRINFDLLITNIGLSFLLIVLFTQPSPGWLIWCLPFFVMYQSTQDKMTILVVCIFTILFVTNFFINDNSYYSLNTDILKQYFDITELQKIQTNLQTLYLASGLIMALTCWKKNILNNSFFRLTRKPFTISIAGDSGAGKDHLTTNLINVLGIQGVTSVSGDNYHLWDRNESNWKFATHLNPVANNLEKFSKDIINLIDGKKIITTYYNHTTGKIENNNSLISNDFIIFSGLHALYTPVLQQCSDLKIFLEPDQLLRKYFKVKRDISTRLYTRKSVLKNIKKRIKDFNKYILPQKKNADLVFSLQLKKNINYNKINETTLLNNLQLNILTRIGIDMATLKNLLTKYSKIKFKNNFYEHGYNSFTIHGKIKKEEILTLTKIMCPDIFELLSIKPKWSSDLEGIVQFITLLHVNKIMTKKII